MTETDLPDVPAWYILVEPKIIERKTKGGLYLTESALERQEFKNTIAKVVKLGDLAYKRTERFPEGPFVKEGDWIVFGHNVPVLRFDYKNKPYLLLKDDDVRLVVGNPDDISQYSGVIDKYED